MSSAGHIIDMIRRENQNRALKEKHRKQYQKVKEAYLTKLQHKDVVHYQTIPPEKLAKIKAEIRTKIKNKFSF